MTRVIHTAVHDELVREVSQGTSEERIAWLLRGIADRIEAARGNPVKLNDLMSVLRENPDKFSKDSTISAYRIQ
ncbi:hypothetical protein [Bradyrhizobium elkanii]|uniref:hypothetical protein n=1 Tax=Bradyrhizobium elkanii TaxID=29448 RepID=UPI0020A040E7|nr:hypothetical protein [Bradyrhizobium elkanii]MCP1931795.1 hypothetical protein [Bradyrhizobium elkanii]